MNAVVNQGWLQGYIRRLHGSGRGADVLTKRASQGASERLCALIAGGLQRECLCEALSASLSASSVEVDILSMLKKKRS